MVEGRAARRHTWRWCRKVELVQTAAIFDHLAIPFEVFATRRLSSEELSSFLCSRRSWPSGGYWSLRRPLVHSCRLWSSRHAAPMLLHRFVYRIEDFVFVDSCGFLLFDLLLLVALDSDILLQPPRARARGKRHIDCFSQTLSATCEI